MSESVKRRVDLGINISADPLLLGRVRALVETHVDFLELSPESGWRPGPEASDGRAVLEGFVRASGKPVVAHGLCYSAGSVGDEARQQSWRRQIAEDRQLFEFGWYSEHLGFVTVGGLTPTLPLPLPPTQCAVEVTAKNLRALRTATGAPVAVENWAALFTLGDARLDGAFFAALCDSADCSLLLDLHNVLVTATNTGVDPDEYLASFPLHRVIGVHLAGGSESDADWLASGRRFRLDSHDSSPPEWEWQALARILPRCNALRGVIVERLDRRVDDDALAEWQADLERARGILDSTEADLGPDPSAPAQVPAPMSAPELAEGGTASDLGRQQWLIALLLVDPQPASALVRCLQEQSFPGHFLEGVAGAAFSLDRALTPAELEMLRRLDSDAFEVTALLVQKIRFTRLCAADPSLEARFAADPARVGMELRAYLTTVAPRALFPSEEWEWYLRWRGGEFTGAPPAVG